MEAALQPLIVEAEFSFKGGNNDELCFKKGDLITVTQREEGGWWEGTLNEKTGWFPSNYVHEYKAPLPITEATRPPEEIQEYRSVVLKDLLDSERAHVAEIQGLLENFLEPLQQTQILTHDEYAQLMCNFVEVVKTHDELLAQMEECNDRVGKLFLTKAPHMKQVHQAYCAAHPRAIVILDKHKDELEKYMERQGAATPGLLVLTTGLSKPFRRLDKYSAMLQELERHMESSHPDRGDTQRSVAVYKDIAATCSATRRQKELELQVLTGPVRGWQGQELSQLGEIIHMGSVAVGVDHRDRYFVLFPQTLIILSVSQRMSAFIYEGKLPLAGIMVSRLEDSESFKNAFEITGPMIERIVAVCQGPNEANKWVELLSSANPNALMNNGSMPMAIKRQLSNLSNSSLGGASHIGQSPAHMSPPANLSLLNQTQMQRSSSSQQQQQQHQPLQTVPSAAAVATSQHKRSLSFNHHLSYNQYTNSPHPPPHHPAHHPQLPAHQQVSTAGAVAAQPTQANQQNHLAAVATAVGHKSNLAHTSSSISKVLVPAVAVALPAAAVTTTTAAAAIATNMAPNVRTANTKANWCITNLRPAPPLRPCLIIGNAGRDRDGSGGGGMNSSNAHNNSGNSSGGGSGGGGGGSGGASGSSTANNPLISYCNSRKNQPTFEEDALVLRVFEAYCAAYQSNARNTIHSALQPWTPCLPIRGGKLKTSKPFSTSNPQLPFLCSSGGGGGGHHGQHHHQQYPPPTSSSSLNSSYIWREASPNSFNLYSSSVSSLNIGGRHSLTGVVSGGGVGGGGGSGSGPASFSGTVGSGLDYSRALSEERATRKSLNRFRSGFGSGYDNICMTPLLPRKSKPMPQISKNASFNAGGATTAPNVRQGSPTLVRQQKQQQQRNDSACDSSLPQSPRPGLYDRRLNRSFETAALAPQHRYAGYGAAYMMDCGALKTHALRRSTPQLGAGNDSGEDVADGGVGTALLMGGDGVSAANGGRHERNGDSVESQRHSGSWCCGLENEDMTPTLRQLWTAIRQMQQDLTQMKLQINEERALRVNLQHLLMQHLEAGSTTSSGSSGPTPKC